MCLRWRFLLSWQELLWGENHIILVFPIPILTRQVYPLTAPCLCLPVASDGVHLLSLPSACAFGLLAGHWLTRPLVRVETESEALGLSLPPDEVHARKANAHDRRLRCRF
eukprot:TRINITY_DN13075_c1_g9_i1.p1 TRINITY_DN13075_c1_g9~~TRINITY_DN13075_c1_g9_i1.p1  ORF type:complete len:110 (-),score=4.66 TRINITY_DN13075_c1_g9_i1:611-940(-)